MKRGHPLLHAGRTLRVDSGATATMDADARLFMNRRRTVSNAGTFNANGDEANGVGITQTAATAVVQNTGTFNRSGTGAFVIRRRPSTTTAR